MRNTPRELAGNYYRRLLIFDSFGRGWKVEYVRLEREPTLLDRLFGRTMDARLVCRAAPEVDMRSVVDELCSLVDGDPDDLYDQFVTHDELKTMFRTAASAAALVDVARRLGGAGQAGA